MTKHIPIEGDFLDPDEWYVGENITKADDFKDDSFPGCQFRVGNNMVDRIFYAINLVTTGKPHYVRANRFKSRVKVEFVGDGEPSKFSGGWLFHN